jgi:hypothetical protein
LAKGPVRRRSELGEQLGPALTVVDVQLASNFEAIDETLPRTNSPEVMQLLECVRAR